MKKKNNLAHIVKTARLKKNLTQITVAKHIGTSVGFIAKLERGESSIRPHRIRNLANTLSIPIKHIVQAKVNDFENILWKSVRK